MAPRRHVLAAVFALSLWCWQGPALAPVNEVAVWKQFRSRILSGCPRDQRMRNWSSLFDRRGDFKAPRDSDATDVLGALLSVMGPRSRRICNRPISNLRARISHELCHRATIIALQSYLPDVHLIQEPGLKGKRPDIFVSNLQTYVEIKTWVWGHQPTNQFKGNDFKQLRKGRSLLLHKFTNRKESKPAVVQQVIAQGGAGPHNTEIRLLALSRVTVLRLFREWVAFLEKNRFIYDAVG